MGQGPGGRGKDPDMRPRAMGQKPRGDARGSEGKDHRTELVWEALALLASAILAYTIL